MPPIIRYFQAVEYTKVKKEKDIYYVQTEWIQKRVLVGDDPNEEFCRITITDLVDYWQRTITSELIEKSFPDSRFLVIRARNRALTDALNGARHERAAPVSWEAAKEPNSDKLRFYLKTYLGDLPLNAGNFLVDRVDESEYMNIRRTWHKNTAIASHAFLEAGVSQEKELEDVNKNLEQMKQCVDTMNRESFEYKLSMFSNFTKVLGTKKEKILELERQVIDEKRKRKYEEIEVKEETKQASTSQSSTQPYSQTQTSSQKVTKKQKTTKTQSSQKATQSQKKVSQSQSSQKTTQSQQASQSQKLVLRARSSPDSSTDLTPPNSSTGLTPPDSSIDLTEDIEEEEEEDHHIQLSLPPRTLPTFDDYDDDYVDEDYDSEDSLYLNCMKTDD